MPRLSAFEQKPPSITTLANIETIPSRAAFDVHRDVSSRVVEMLEQMVRSYKETWADFTNPYEEFISAVGFIKLLFPEKNLVGEITPEQLEFLKTILKRGMRNNESLFSMIRIVFPQVWQYADEHSIVEHARELIDSYGTMANVDWSVDWRDYAHESIVLFFLDPSMGARPTLQEVKPHLLRAIAEYRREKELIATFIPLIVIAKLFYGEKIKLTPVEWRWALDELDLIIDDDMLESSVEYLQFALWLKIIAAEEVAVTDGKFELVMSDDERKTPDATPPTRRQF